MKIGMKSFGAALPIVLVLSGCVTHAPRGSVAMTAGEREGHVHLGKGEVSEGERVAFFRHDCEPTVGAAGRLNDRDVPLCRHVKVGEGQVVKVLDEDYSVVRADPGVRVEKGLDVEPM